MTERSLEFMPEALLTPERWPEARAIESGIPLELYVSVGGKLKVWLKACVKAGSPWRTALFGGGKRRFEVLDSAVREAWRESVKDLGLSALVLDRSSGEQGFQRALEYFGGEAVLALERPQTAEPESELSEWIGLVFPEFLRAWHVAKSPASLHFVLSEYEREMPLVRFFPWDELSYFPSYLRAYKKASASELELASLDWARFQALISPHDELGEAESLSANEVMLNPSLQILTQEVSGRMLFVARDPLSLDVTLHEASFMEAVLVEHLSEDFRTSAPELLAQASTDLGDSHTESSVSLHKCLERLCARGIILCGTSAGGR